MILGTRGWRVATTAAYILIFLAIGISASWLGPALPNLADHVKTGLSAISFVFVGRYAGVMCGILFGGWTFDRVRGHPLMIVMLLTMALFTALVPFSSALWQLVLILFALGFASGNLDVGGNTLLVWIYRGRVGPYMNGLHVFFSLGAIITPILFVRLLIIGNLQLPLWTISVFILLTAVWLLFLKSPTSNHTTVKEESDNGFRLLIILVSAFFLLYVGAEAGIQSWIFTYSLTMGLAGEFSAAFLNSLFWIFITLGRLIIIPLYAHIRPTTILMVDLIGCIASISLILLLPGSEAALWFGIGATGLFMGSIFPTTLTFTGERIGATSRLTSLFLVGASLGAMSVPWAIGQLFSLAGPTSFMTVILGTMLAAFGFMLIIIRQVDKPKKVKEQVYEY
jgi:fucose permease